MSGVPAPGAGRHPVRRLRPRGRQADPRGQDRLRRHGHRRPAARDVRADRELRRRLARRSTASSTLTDKLEFAPYAASHRPWTFLTAAFLHSPTNVLHIALEHVRAVDLRAVPRAAARPGPVRRPLPRLGARRVGRLPAAGPARAATSGTRPPGGRRRSGPPGRSSGCSPRWWCSTARWAWRTMPIFVLIGINAVLSFCHPRHRLAGPPRRPADRRPRRRGADPGAAGTPRRRAVGRARRRPGPARDPDRGQVRDGSGRCLATGVGLPGCWLSQ